MINYLRCALCGTELLSKKGRSAHFIYKREMGKLWKKFPHYLGEVMLSSGEFVAFCGDCNENKLIKLRVINELQGGRYEN